jgi:hypothetical protein
MWDAYAWKICFHVISALNYLSWVLNRCMMFTNEKSHIYKWTHASVALTWHEIACRCLWWPCDENVWPCVKFVSYMLYVLFLSCLGPMLMRGKFLWKMLHFHHGYITCLYAPLYLVGDACAQILAILLVYVSILSCCSALCIFEKHMLAFVDLIHALPTRGRKVPNSCFQGELAFMHLGDLFRLNVSCALWPMLSSPFASPWGVNNLRAFYLGCVELLPLP